MKLFLTLVCCLAIPMVGFADQNNQKKKKNQGPGQGQNQGRARFRAEDRANAKGRVWARGLDSTRAGKRISARARAMAKVRG